MSVAGVLTPDGATSGYTASPVVSSNVDTMESAWAATTQGSLSNSAQLMTDDAFASRADIIKQRFGKSIRDISGLSRNPLNVPGQSSLSMQSPLDNISAIEKYNRQKTDEFILQGRQTDPEQYKDIKTSDEIMSAGAAAAGMTERQHADILSRNPSRLASSANFIGSMGAMLKDPMNLAGMMFGAGEAKLTLKGLAQAGAINAGIVGLSQPGVAEWQKKIGNKYGLADAAENVGEAALTGVALHTLLHGVVLPAFRAGKNMLGSSSQYVLDKMTDYWRSTEGAQTMPPGEAAAAADSAAYMSRVAHIDEGAPPGAVTDEQTLAAHRDTVAQVADDLENYREPTPPTHAEDPAPIQPPELDPRFEEPAAPAENVRDPAVLAEYAARLEELKAGKADTSVKSPILQYLKALGGVKVGGPLDADLRAMGITPKTAPGLFKRLGGRGEVDNIPLSEFADHFGVEPPVTADGYVDPAWLREQIRAETHGAALGVDKGPQMAMEDFIRTVQDRGLDPATATPEQVYDVLDSETDLSRQILDTARAQGDTLSIGDVQHIKEIMKANPEYLPEDAIAEHGERTADMERFDAMSPPEKVEPLQSAPFDITENDRLAQKRANFDQLLAEDPHMLVTMEDGSAMTLRQLADKVKGDLDVIEAITTCRLA